MPSDAIAGSHAKQQQRIDAYVLEVLRLRYSNHGTQHKMHGLQILFTLNYLSFEAGLLNIHDPSTWAFDSWHIGRLGRERGRDIGFAMLVSVIDLHEKRKKKGIGGG